jgi:integrase
VQTWVEHYVDVIKSDALAPNTARSYHGHLHKWIGPHLGRLPLGELRAEHIEKMFAAMRQAGLSAATCERVRASLRAALTVAVRRNLVIRNVAALAVVPHRDNRVSLARPLTTEEAQVVLRVAATWPDAARWGLALLGMRPGEALGTDWAQIDLEAGTLVVHQQLVEVYPYRHGCGRDDTACRARKALYCPSRAGGRMLTRPKSLAGSRKVFLPPELADQLRAHRTLWLAERLQAHNAWQEQWGDLVFCRPDGSPLDTARDRRRWRDLLRAAGVTERRLYDARHTAGTLLLERGGDLHQVKELLGHSQISVSSQYYVHATDRLGQDTAARLGGALFGLPAIPRGRNTRTTRPGG